MSDFDLVLDSISINKDITYDRLDGRKPVDFTNQIESANAKEDYHMAHITQVHNKSGFGFDVFAAELGPRKGFVEDYKKISNNGDYTLFFDCGGDPFKVNIELKSRVGRGNVFRVKEYDIYNCIKKNIPYLLIHNAKTEFASILLLKKEDLIYIRDNFVCITHETRNGKPWNCYQSNKNVPSDKWKKYSKRDINDLRFKNHLISYADLKRDGTHDEWLEVIKYFRCTSGNQLVDGV